MFNFGKNWKEYSRNISEEHITQAEDSLKKLFETPDFSQKSFLDIGCGSGVFAIAAKRLGAMRVLGIDVLKDSVECSQDNASKFFPDASEKISFQNMSILDPEFKRLGTFDIVYAWGSLHHSGQMLEAIRHASELVAPGGTFLVAIYNKNITSPMWKGIKWLHHKSPSIGKKVIEFWYFAMVVPFKILFFRKDFFQKERGMKVYYDAIDWVGGYPFEYATKKEMDTFVSSLGFKLKKCVPTKGLSGCNEFVFEKI